MAKARRADQEKNIFCLETYSWFKNKDRTSVEPLLELLKRMGKIIGYFDYLRRDVATRSEFEYFLNEYFHDQYKNYPILQLSFHGSDDPPSIFLGDGEQISLDDLARMIDGRCSKRVVYFGSCSTMNTHGATLNKFMRNTGALAIFGYREDVDFLQSTAFEALILGRLQKVSFTKQGMKKFDQLLRKQAWHLYKTLGFRPII